MQRQYPYTAHYVEGDQGWVVAFAAEFPTIVTQGRTIEEARARLRGAVEVLLEENAELTRERTEGRHVLLIEPQTTGRPA
jgi:predicted RNase H-like HicB family nuclease